MEELVRLLSPLEGQKRHSDIRTKRFHGTGTWLLGMPEFETWRDGVGDGISNVLVCYGNPGAGKTVLWFVYLLVKAYTSMVFTTANDNMIVH
jgi:hypothetical protein